MEILKETFANFGALEWSMLISMLTLIVTVLFFNKGAVKAKEKLETYEQELRNARKENESLKQSNQRLIATFEERSEN